MLEVEYKYEVTRPSLLRHYFKNTPTAYPPQRLLADYFEDRTGVTASRRFSIRTRWEGDAVILTLKAGGSHNPDADGEARPAARYEWPLLTTPVADEAEARRVMADYRERFGEVFAHGLEAYASELRDPRTKRAYRRVAGCLREIPRDSWQRIGGSDVLRSGVTLGDDAGRSWMFSFDEGRLTGGGAEASVCEAEFEWLNPPEASEVTSLPDHPMPEVVLDALRPGTLASKHARIRALYDRVTGNEGEDAE